jgi:hypothetical protein
MFNPTEQHATGGNVLINYKSKKTMLKSNTDNLALSGVHPSHRATANNSRAILHVPSKGEIR